MAALRLPDGFIIGATRFNNPNPEQPCIIIPVRFNMRSPEWCVIDTASTRSILRPDLSRSLGLTKPRDALVETLKSRFGEFPGWVERVSVELVTETSLGGQNLQMEIRVFIPEPQRISKIDYDGPNILGMLDFLEGLRFAVDPSTQLFYFGEATDVG